MDVTFNDLQNKLIIEEKMDTVHAAILAADIQNYYSEPAKKAISAWTLGEDISSTIIGSMSVADIIDELNCSPFKAVCILDAIEKDPSIFEDAVLVLWKDGIL